MLKRLLIQNYILIDSLDIDFSPGLTIVTGETGAGKSILLGALSLILGQRADAGTLLTKSRKCIIEGTFDISNYDLHDFFKSNELDYEKETSLRREISPEGKSRAFINDTPVTLNILRDLAATLVDIHSQHETLTLGKSSFQLSVVDAFAAHEGLLHEYYAGYSMYLTTKNRLASLMEEESKSRADLDYVQFQFNELQDAQLMDGEQELLESEAQRLVHAEEIRRNLDRAVSMLQGNEENILQSISTVAVSFSSIAKYDAAYVALSDRMKSVAIELKDITAEAEQFSLHVNADPGRMEVINERLNVIYRLQQKHHVNTISALLELHTKFSDRLSGIESMESTIEKMQKELEELHQQLVKKAGAISANRNKAIPKIEKAIRELTTGLAMPNAMLKIEMETGKDN